MNNKDFEKILKNTIPELYSFSFALIPDDLQAQQIVIDTFTVIGLQEKRRTGHLGRLKAGAEEGPLRKILYKYVFDLSKKRYGQLQESFLYEKSLNGKYETFYQLDICERAILFLTEKTSFSLHEIGQIVILGDHELISRWNLARENLLRLIGHDELVL